MISPLYWHPAVYDVVLRHMYGQRADERVARIAAEIRDGESVLDVCCGTGILARHGLADRRVTYLGLDENPRFVRHLNRAGASARVADVLHEPFPEADVVVLQASLYHFHEDAEPFVRKLQNAARRAVIICEPVHNLAQAAHPWVARLAGFGAATRAGAHSFRFDEAGFTALMGGLGARSVEYLGRDMIAVLHGTAVTAS